MLAFRLLIALLKTFFSLKRKLSVSNDGGLAYVNSSATHLLYFLFLTAALLMLNYILLPARRYASAGLRQRHVRSSVRLSHAVLCLAERKQDHEMYTI